MTVRNEIKAQIVRAGYTMQEVVDRLHEEYGWSDSVSNLSAKLQRESIRYKEVNYQISGRELLTPDEVRMLDNRYALLFVRGERPVMDLKYDILKHPNVKLTTDGGQPPYLHGEPTQAVATLVFDSDIPKDAVTVQAVSTSYELLSEEDLEELFKI